MRRIQLLLTTCAALAAAPVCLPAPAVREGAMEKLPLFAVDPATAWSTSESTIDASGRYLSGGSKAWHWHVTVDHTSGEPRYPIGWPRMSRAIAANGIRDWSGWDFLLIRIYSDTSRASLPKIPAGLGLHTPDRSGAYNRTLSELRKGEWVEIRIPLSQVPRHHDVRQVQFHIAESNYQHGDQIDFHVGELALLRYAEPALLEFGPERAVVFEDATQIPVTFQLAGVKPGASVPVTCELWRQGRVVLRGSLQASRGKQRLVLDASGTTLPPGLYELQAGLTGARQAASSGLRVVESPWR